MATCPNRSIAGRSSPRSRTNRRASRRPDDLGIAGFCSQRNAPSRPAPPTAPPPRHGGPGGDPAVAGDVACAAPSEALAAYARLSRLKRLIDSSGLNTRTADDKAWVVAYSGEHLETVAVYVSLYD